jgi:hypothetical protein
VSRIEAGRQTPSAADLEAWAAASGSPDTATSLVGALRSLESHYQEKRRAFHAGLTTPQRAFGGMESRAGFIRNFESVFVPGLLQTSGYARGRLAVAIDYTSTPAGDLDEAVAVRLQRQQVLHQPGKKIHIVITEAALRYRLCDEVAMAA